MTSFGKTIRAYAQPYIYQMQINEIYCTKPKFNPELNGLFQDENEGLDIIPGDFWLNSFADILTVGQNVPIKYLYTQKPTRDAIKSGYWTESQRNLMKLMDKEYDKLAEYIIKNF